jgi:hypothetical protein
MKAIYDKRLQALEATVRPPEVTRILNRVINPDRSLHSFYAKDSLDPIGRSFSRLPGEDDHAFEARVYAEMGWPIDEEPTP